MSKGMRLTERWMHLCLWLVALAFAGFLIGLGGKVVDNLDFAEDPASVSDFIDPVRGPKVLAAYRAAKQAHTDADDALDQARLAHQKAAANSSTAEDTFNNWVKTRMATAGKEHDGQLLDRTRDLDALKAAERAALGAVEAQQQAKLNASQALERASAEWSALERPAIEAAYHADEMRALRVFGYRLALTLPLLGVAGWLFARQRKGSYWPFAWGFILFALFAFFVELVPYLPSFGGYVRYGVGIVLTIVAGRYAIRYLQRFRERQQAAEALPDTERRATLSYDKALARLAKSVCPGCERSIDVKMKELSFCPHCGMGIATDCTSCHGRKSVFAPFCLACGCPDQRNALA
ncbi:zinc ribbon domain-containing protein [Massilia soli]|uniref:Serine endopeptidase n=1 Tax=Massilia soli TaxID=2792854 RepID=A0ABS7SMH9_9BURK|nr:zinc ribbon domain-containing protein [Massilia soli]MBZ2207388.1 serine endopeptidase [Massilia soli]